jgi:hypothetical protein
MYKDAILLGVRIKRDLLSHRLSVICPRLLIPYHDILVLVILHLLHQDWVRLESWLHLEKLIHALERNALCLRNKEKAATSQYMYHIS